MQIRVTRHECCPDGLSRLWPSPLSVCSRWTLPAAPHAVHRVGAVPVLSCDTAESRAKPISRTDSGSISVSDPHAADFQGTTRRKQVGEILDEGDVDWPFVLEGEFDDATLISVIEFIRAQPLIPMPAFIRSVPAAPIVGIQRRDDAIVVGLRTRNSRLNTPSLFSAKTYGAYEDESVGTV